MLGDFYKKRINGMFGGLFHDWLTMELTAGNVMELFVNITIEMLIMLTPIFAIIMIVGVIGNVIQFGFLLTGEPLKMQLNKLNPIEGFKRIFSMRSLAEFFKSILKVTIIAILVYIALIREWKNILVLSSQPIEAIFAFTADLTVSLGIEIGAVLTVLAFLDFLYQKYEHEKV